jgi:hypothetical protein
MRVSTLPADHAVSNLVIVEQGDQMLQEIRLIVRHCFPESRRLH